jgi:hypothetical protein
MLNCLVVIRWGCHGMQFGGYQMGLSWHAIWWLSDGAVMACSLVVIRWGCHGMQFGGYQMGLSWHAV